MHAMRDALEKQREAATRAGAHDERGREALPGTVFRPPIAQDRITRGPDGLNGVSRFHWLNFVFLGLTSTPRSGRS